MRFLKTFLFSLILASQVNAAKISNTEIAAGHSGYAWSYTPILQTPTITDNKGNIVQLKTFWLGWPACGWEKQNHIGFVIPEDTVPGDYTFQSGTFTTSLKVVPKAVHPVAIRISANATVEEIEKQLRVGDIELSPVRYKLSRALIIPPKRRIYMNDATLVRDKPGDYRNRVIVPNTNFELIGPGKVQNYDNDSIVFHSTGTAYNCVLKEITFYKGGFGYWESQGLRVKDCTFNKCGITNLRNGLWTGIKCKGISRTKFEDASSFWPACSVAGGGAVCLLDWEFDSTPQGIRIEATEDVSEILIAGVNYRSVSMSNNQCELFGTEGKAGTIRNIIYFHHRDEGCVGPAINIWDTHTEDCLFRDGRSTSTAYLSGADNAVQTGIQVMDWEAADFVTGPTAINNIFKRCGVVPKPSRQNQFGDDRPFNPTKPVFNTPNNQKVECWQLPVSQ